MWRVRRAEPPAPTPLPAIRLDLGDQVAEIAVRRSPRALRLSLKLDPALGTLVMVLPPRTSLAEAQRFAAEQRHWVAERLARVPARIPFAIGTHLPLAGSAHEIHHTPQARRGVWVEAGRINVSGHAEHLPRRLETWLKAEARRRILPLVHDLAARLGRPAGRVSVRDTRSRWGSCSSRGDLSFSWRLVLAPDWVLAYVVAHEVAHLAEHNHSPAFWRVVASLAGDPSPARRWLKTNGADLHRYG
ncbi:MAG: M48 family metallopeptidase [Magnetospirillum sp.]|nr:M48 family metallopeptidase [Magnetospirillum sp.]